MKAFGPRSVSSFAMAAVNLAMGMLVLALVLMTVLLASWPIARAAGVDMQVDTAWLVIGSTTMAVPVAVEVDSRMHRVQSASLGIEEAQFRTLKGLLRFPVRSMALFAANAGVVILMLAFGLFVLGQLRAVLRTLRDRQPFAAANAARVRWIGYGLIAAELARSLLVFVENYYAMTHFRADGFMFGARYDLDLGLIVAGLIVLALSEVFRVGARLDEDQSLTI